METLPGRRADRTRRDRPSTRPPRARRAATGLAAVALAATSVVAPSLGAVGAAEARPADRFPDTIALPDGFMPEGIAVGRGPTAYVGSLADGDIARVDLRTGRVQDGFSTREGTSGPSVGLDTDRRGRLFVAGGTAGDARVVDTRTGDVLASYQVSAPDEEPFINDVVVTKDAAYLTDSQAARLFVLPLQRNGALPPAGRVRELPLTGGWTQVAGQLNANGIAPTPDGAGLLVVNSAIAELYRVDPRTGRARVVDLGGASLDNGDGLLLRGRTLLAVQNRLNRVAVVELSRDGTSGRVARTLSDDDFDVPTTIDRFGGAYYLPNARFGTAGDQPAEYSVVRLED